MKKGNKKLPIILALTAVLVIVAVVVAVIVLNSGHRVIKVESFEGAVALVRGSKEAELVDGMNLKSKDIITTGADGLIELLVDADKHILAQEDTAFTIIASGNDKKGKLKIELVYGTSLVEIDNKLADGSEVEVITPNASLSVRGTTFETSYKEADNTTVVKVTDGVVNVASDTESVEVTAGQMATVRDDEIEVEQLPIAYNNVTTFAIRYMSNHEYSDIYVKELVGWTYDAVEKDSQKPDGYTNNGVEIGYWIMTEDEVTSILEVTEHEPEDYLDNDDRDMVICAAFDYRDDPNAGNMGYVYYKKLEDEMYLGIIVSDNGSGALVDTDIKTYLPLTNDCYYSYGSPLGDESAEGETIGEGVSESESSKKEVTLGTMEVTDENSSKKIILTYNADYYTHEEDYYIQIEGTLGEIAKEYDCSHGYKSAVHVLFVADSSAQEYYNNTQVTYAERGWTLSEMRTATVCGRTAYVYEEYWDESMTVNKTHILMEEEGNVMAFFIPGGNVFNVDGYIVEIESFLIDMEVAE